MTASGDWVVKIGAARPGSGVAHRVVAVTGSIVRLACGRRIAETEILDRVPPGTEGRCRGCR